MLDSHSDLVKLVEDPSVETLNHQLNRNSQIGKNSRRNLSRRKEQLQLHGPSLVPDLAQGCATLQKGGGPAGGTQTQPGTISLHQHRGGDGRKTMLNSRNSLKGSLVTKVRAVPVNISTGGKSLFML